MKKRSTTSLITLTVYALLLLALACSGGGKIKVGSNVAATWGESWYLAKVTAINTEKGEYDVTYADNTTGAVDTNNIKLIPDNAKFRVGDKVLAAWSGARLYAGTVNEIKDDGYMVKWDDGSDPTMVANGKLLKNWK